MPHSTPCPGPLSRRQFLSLTGAGLGGLGITNLTSLRALGAPTVAKDTAVIFLWLPGGPSQLETWDMKPDAPSEIRGAFRPIKTNVPGIDICEHMPLLAKCADKYTLIRSVSHQFADHGGGHKRFLTGRDPREPTGFVNDYPMVGSMVAKLRESVDVGLPNYVAGVDGGRQGIDTFSFGSAYLGAETHPFIVAGDPSEKNFQVKNLDSTPEQITRLEQRMELRQVLQEVHARGGRSATNTAIDQMHTKALDLISSSKARAAFDLTREDQKTREQYGLHRYGQRCLLARRLVEAGSSFVSMVLENPGNLPDATCYNWDSHAVNCNVFTDTQHKLPYLDQAVSALLSDLYARGLDKRVLVICTGEFGRTPRLEYQKGRPGRDHWPSSMSMLVSGGGMRTGQVIGATDKHAARPIERPLSPNDLWASMFYHLGIDIEHTFPDHAGRPMPILPHGQLIPELGIKRV